MSEHDTDTRRDYWQTIQKMGTLLYADEPALERLTSASLPKDREMTVSQSQGSKRDLQIGLKNILGLASSDELGSIATLRQKIERTEHDLVLEAILQLEADGQLAFDLRTLPVAPDEAFGRSFFVLLNAHFVCREDIDADTPPAKSFVRMKCVEFGDEFEITMGVGGVNLKMGSHHLRELFANATPTVLTVLGSATCKSLNARSFYIKPFAIFLSGSIGSYPTAALEKNMVKWQDILNLVRDFLSSGSSPKDFCRRRNVTSNELAEAIRAVENAGLFDRIAVKVLYSRNSER
jgi:hypothetical protein